MQRLIDKLLLVGLCILILSFSPIELILIVALLTAVATSSLLEYFDTPLSRYLCIVYSLLCLIFPSFISFLPLIVYDYRRFGNLFLRYSWAIVLLEGFVFYELRSTFAALLLSGIALLLINRTQGQLNTQNELYSLTDKAKEQSLSFESRNRQLIEKQDYELRLSTLGERNRISRDIHDNVGHILTRSILQTKALQVTYSDDEKLSSEINHITESLTEAMDSIRSSIHDLHDESLDLRMQLETMIDAFSFCPVRLEYDASNLMGAIKYCFIAVAREALSNIAKHTNATEALISVVEHPAFCRIIIQDNGSISPSSAAGGIGLKNMADRVDALGGVFRAESTKGYRIYISIPKEQNVYD